MSHERHYLGTCRHCGQRLYSGAMRQNLYSFSNGQLRQLCPANRGHGYHHLVPDPAAAD